jgi:hypothetical protein
MRYKSPGIGSITNKGRVTYLPPGYGIDDMKEDAITGGAAEQTNVFPNGIIVTGGIQTDDLTASDEIASDKLTVDSGSDLAGGVNVTGDLQLDGATEILHGTKFRTRVSGERLIREYSADGGTTWLPGDEIGE